MAARIPERLFLIGSESASHVCGAWNLRTGKRRIQRGEGAYLWTADGERYLDFAGGVAVMRSAMPIHTLWTL